MTQLESVGDLPQSGREFIKRCAGRISYTRESEGPFQGGFKEIQLNCQACGIVSATLGEPLLGMSVPLAEEKVIQATEGFLDSYCGISLGLIRPGTLGRRGQPVAPVPAKFQGQTSQLEKLGLTPRQGEVLTRMLQGQSPKEIDRDMHIETSTVYRYLHLIRHALGVQTTSQMMIKAIQLGFEVSYPGGDKFESQ